jgi:miniconductance mechanosensitive channel
MDYFKDVFIERGMNRIYAEYMSGGILIILIFILCVIINLIVRKFILKLLTRYIENSKYRWDNIMLKRRVFHRLAHIVPAIIVYNFAPAFKYYTVVIHRAVLAYIFLIITFILDALLDAFNDIYKSYPISKSRPIKGLIQIVKIVLYIIVGIITIANLMGERPIALLSGIGALTAVISLVFKDSILGFVAGIQFTSNNMLRIGDWIEMPKYGADGEVIEVTLNTVKVQNFDKTIVTIPAYTLVSDSFKNWRGMQESGGRRIKRPVYIDTASIKFCNQEMIEKFKKIHYLTDYITEKEEELKKYNEVNSLEDDLLINGRHLTNIGTFRTYIQNYVSDYPGIHRGMNRVVRQLQPNEYGLPLEIYAFTESTDWVNYEKIQADIFDHILAVAGEFELRVFQNPTGYDLRHIGH